MEKITTNYGTLNGVSYVVRYLNGKPKECYLAEQNDIVTQYGVLVPQYQDDGLRRKHTKPLSFHENGNLKNVPLACQTMISTPIGVLPAEQITFYDSGSIRRIFPLDGKLTGFWGEEDEYSLAQEFEFSFAFGQFKQKIISINFYENAAVKSITFWPTEKVMIEAPVGRVETRIGISLYPSGVIKSIEPSTPFAVETPIGKITAYNLKAHGIHGDANSLKFSEEGKIESVVTSAEEVEVTNSNGQRLIIQPGLKPSMFNLDMMDVIPMDISFQGNKVCFNKNPELEFELKECTFVVKPYLGQPEQHCSSCNGCTACG